MIRTHLFYRASVICPWGEDGAVAITNCDRPELVTSTAFPPAKVVDTLGAGDTFIGATISALCLGRSLQDAITYGCKIAGAKCGIQGLGGLKHCESCLT